MRRMALPLLLSGMVLGLLPGCKICAGVLVVHQFGALEEKRPARSQSTRVDPRPAPSDESFTRAGSSEPVALSAREER